MGIERLLAILTEQDNLRDVVLFPLMKSTNDNIQDTEAQQKHNESPTK
jgi:aspartyl-tRNA synthetase